MCKWLSIQDKAAGLGIGNATSPLRSRTPAGTDECRPCPFCLRLCAFICDSIMLMERVLFGALRSLWFLLFLPLLWGSLREEWLIEKCSLGLSVKGLSLTHCLRRPMLCRSFYVEV